MCGIAGLINKDKNRIVHHRDLKLMTDTIIHRGPDDDGFYIDKNVGLGFRRLSIIDLEAGKQPMCNESDDIWVVMNGEIYNFIHLRNDLINKGHRFKSKSDTEVLVHLYEDYGVDFVKKLRGMFAIALYDKKNCKLVLARDRVGIKPLYFTLTNNSFYFCSELKEIIKIIPSLPHLNKNAVLDYFTYGYILGAKCIFEGIQKLLPAHYLELDLNTFDYKIVKYWEIHVNPDYSKTENDWIEILNTKLSETVKLHMISDVPLGAFLSGGVDSSGVVATMAQNSSQPIQTFSIGFNEIGYSELDFARHVSQIYKTNHHEMILEPASIDIIDNLINIYDEPFADSSAIPTYFVSKFTREFVTVALSGDGGDELFAGYKSYLKFKKIVDVQKFIPTSFRSLIGKVNRVLPNHLYGKGMSYYYAQSPSLLGAYYNIFKDYEIEKLFKYDFLREVKPYSSIGTKCKMLEEYNTTDLITKNELLDVNTYLIDDILTKVDRASMANSLEVRVPLLDHEMIELAFQIPSSMKIKNFEGKYILKKALEHSLPKNLLYRKKQGFAVPLNKWFQGDLQSYIMEELSSKNNLMNDYLNKKTVNKIIDNHILAKRDFSEQIWSILFFNVWYKKLKESN